MNILFKNRLWTSRNGHQHKIVSNIRHQHRWYPLTALLVAKIWMSERENKLHWGHDEGIFILLGLFIDDDTENVPRKVVNLSVLIWKFSRPNVIITLMRFWGKYFMIKWPNSGMHKIRTRTIIHLKVELQRYQRIKSSYHCIKLYLNQTPAILLYPLIAILIWLRDD